MVLIEINKYKFHNKCKVKKIYLKRRSDGAPSGEKLCLYKSNSNAETADSNNQKDKKLCIKFKEIGRAHV